MRCENELCSGIGDARATCIRHESAISTFNHGLKEAVEIVICWIFWQRFNLDIADRPWEADTPELASRRLRVFDDKVSQRAGAGAHVWRQVALPGDLRK